ncbi:MAG: hypothetical protein OXT49_05390 [Gammaproteobacteria bacterium]|nr:hypothetical protein [Gammaproteobacteria bacterium]
MSDDQNTNAYLTQHNNPPNVLWTLNTSLEWLRENGDQLWLKSKWPFLLMVFIGLLELFFVGVESQLINITISVVLALFTALLAVSTHRLILLGADKVPDGGQISLSWREVKFVLYEWLMFLSIALIFVVISAIGVAAFGEGIFSHYIYSFVPIIAFIWLFLRWSFMFPAIAIDEPTNVSIAWYDSAGWLVSYGLACVAAWVAVFLPVVMLAFLMVWVSPESEVFGWALEGVLAVVAAIAIWATVIPLSLAYGRATGKDQESASASEE